MSKDAHQHILELPRKLSQLDLTEKTNKVKFVYLHGDRLYTEAGETLYVYSVADVSSPLATFPLDDHCFSGIICDSRLYLGTENMKLHIFEVTSSPTSPQQPPLTLATVIETHGQVFKMVKIGQELLMCEDPRYLQILDTTNSKITGTHKF
jgi:hypothetical protein